MNNVECRTTSAKWTMNSVHVYNLQFPLYTIHCTLYSVLSTVYSGQSEYQQTWAKTEKLQQEAAVSPANTTTTNGHRTLNGAVVQYCTALHCTALYITVLHYTALNCIVQYSTVLKCTALNVILLLIMFFLVLFLFGIFKEWTFSLLLIFKCIVIVQ